MAKITRKTALIFAGSASAAPNGVAQFGSLANNTPTFSLDPAVIQALDQWDSGWNAALVGGAAPALEDQNAVDYVNSYQTAYLLQQGIAEWDSGTTYFVDSFCQYNGQIYQSLINTNLNNNPASSPLDWVVFSTSSSWSNIIRNAGMTVAQRGTSGTITAGAWGYTLDGWICSSTGANCAWLQVFGDATPPLGASLQLTPAGALTHLYVKQRIRSSYVVNLAGGNVTVQATIFNNTGGTVTPTITVNVPSAAADTWGGEPGTVVNLVPTTNLQACPNITVTTVAFTFALGTSVNWSYGLEVIFDFTNQVPNGREIYIGNVNLSPTPNLAAGVCSYPPTVQINPYAIELQNCLAFYEHLVQSSEVLGTAFSSTQAIFVYKYTVPKVGTVTISNSLVGNFVLQLLVGGLTQLIVTSLAYGSMGGTNAMVDIIATVASGLSTSNPVILLGEGSASLIAFSSEL
jgi:hypothetical protein